MNTKILMKDLLKVEKTVLGAELCSSSVSLSLPLDELPGPLGVQSTESTHSTSSDVQKTMAQHSSATTAKPNDACCFIKLHNLSAIVEKINISESAIKKWTINSYFEEIQARVPVLSGVRNSLKEWKKSLNGLTQLKKFKELETLMYGDPTQGPSIVSRSLLLASLCQRSVDTAEMLQMLCTIKCYCRVFFKCNIRVFITNWSQELNTKLCIPVRINGIDNTDTEHVSTI